MIVVRTTKNVHIFKSRCDTATMEKLPVDEDIDDLGSVVLFSVIVKGW